jgi:alpha-L-fucosidase
MNLTTRITLAGTLALALFQSLETFAADKLQPAPKDVPSAPKPESLKRWEDMRLGMFIHWGPVSISGLRISWSRGSPTPVEVYDNLYKKFDAPQFDADAWASIAKAAGMKYVVLTTKHHDGFCLWDTKQTDYNVMHSPLKRDVVKELSEACRKQGLAFGTYYSICDWHNPDFPRTGIGGSERRVKSDIEAYRRFLHAQVTELLSSYGPIQVMWFDVPQEFDAEQGWDNVRFCRSIQPDILVNDRAGGHKGDLVGDYSTPERRIGGFDMVRPWESCMTLCNSWSWKTNDQLKSLAECIQSLVSIAGGDGNLLFNVGPMPDGRIEPRQADRLCEMGSWLEKYGQTIYATRGGPFKPAKHVVSTRAGKTVYVHILGWPEEVLHLPPLPANILSHRLLTGGTATLQNSAQGMDVSVPKSDRSEIDTILALELDTDAIDIAPIPVAGVNLPLTEGKAGAASNVRDIRGNVKRYGADKALDGDLHTRWATEDATRQCWLEVDLGKAQTFDHAVIIEAGSSVQRFELQAKDGDNWKTFHSGQTIGPSFEIRFPPVTAQRVRLNILDAAKGPSISEFQIFSPTAESK